jgi:hypothetical protein
MRRTTLPRLSLLAVLLVPALHGQPTVAPTPATVGRTRGEEVNSYNVVHWFETGYRFHSVSGNRGRYRSDVNFGNGARLLQSHLTVHSKEGHGRLFDEIVLNTQGLGNDPYQFAGLRLQRNSLYRYELNWRLNEYLNPGLNTGTLAGHLVNTRRQLQDHDLTLLPQSPIRLFLGYSRNTQDGPGLSSINLFDATRGDEFPLFAGIDRRQREYRLGGQISARGINFTVLRGWQQFRETTAYGINALSPGANAADASTLNSFSRQEPYEGSTPFWRFVLGQDNPKWYSFNGRFSYAGSRRNFILEEAAVGTSRFGAAQNRQVLVTGSGRRPVSSGAFTIGLHPGNRLTLTNQTAFHQIQMDGDSAFREINNAGQAFNLLRFQSLGIRTIHNSTDALFQASPWFAVYGGHRYSTRRVRTVEGLRFAADTDLTQAAQDNRLNSGLAGLRLQPVKPLSISLDAEIGRADRPFLPVSERSYHVLAARVQYKAGNLRLAASSRANYNFNSVSLFNHSSRARNHSFDASWTGRSWISFDASYSKLHLDTLSALAYFSTSRLINSDRSLYVSNIHAGSASARFSLRRRADLFVGYSRVQDTGDGRATAAGRSVSSQVQSGTAAFLFAQTFPISFDSPQVRLSVQLRDKLRWNFGYQHYRYREDFQPQDGYRAHTGFSSLQWSF